MKANATAKALSVLSVIMVLAVACGPTVYADADDGGERVVTLSELREMAYSEDGDPTYGLGFVAGLIIGLAVGGLVGGLAGYAIGSNPVQNAYNESGMNTTFSQMEANTVKQSLDTALHLVTSVLPADTDLWKYTTDYWQKMMEFIVYDAWTPDNSGFEKNSLNMLYNTGLIQNAGNYVYSWSNAIDQAYNKILERSYKWIGGDGLEYTESMGLSIEWDGGSIRAVNGSEDGVISIDFCQVITVTEDTAVYIDMDPTSDGFETRNSGLMYNFSSGSKTIQKVDAPNIGTTKVLNRGANDITDLKSGTYSLPTGTYAGPMISIAGETDRGLPAGTVSGGLVVTGGDGSVYLFTTDGDPESATYTIRNSAGSAIGTTDALTIVIDQYGGSESKSVILGVEGNNTSSTSEDGVRLDMLTQWDAMIRQINTVINQTYEAGEATWTIFDACEAKDSAIHPSTVNVSIPGQNLTSEEYIVLYLNTMAQIHDYAETHANDLNGLEITTNMASLDLVCYGDIYVNGQAWAENVVFTPYIYTQSQTLTLGTNTFNGSGSAIIWAQVDDFDSWNQQMSTASATTTPLESGYVLEIERIVYKGENTDSVDIDLAEIGRYGTGSNDDPGTGPAPVPDTLDVTVFYALVIAELGVIIILLGRMMNMQILILAGIIVLAVGVMIPEAIEGILTGSFDWGQLVPFGWI